GLERGKRSEQLALEIFLRRLRRARHVAQQRAAMTGDSLEIEYLCTLRGKRGQQTRFAATGETTDEPEAESLRMRCQRRNDVPAVCAIAAVELRCAPAEFAQHVHQGEALM